jgi:hypothetical protein
MRAITAAIVVVGLLLATEANATDRHFVRPEQPPGHRQLNADLAHSRRLHMGVSFNMLSSLDRCLVLVGSGDGDAIIGVDYAALSRPLPADTTPNYKR